MGEGRNYERWEDVKKIGKKNKWHVSMSKRRGNQENGRYKKRVKNKKVRDRMTAQGAAGRRFKI